MNETLNRQKPGLYILPQDEKLVKKFDMEIENQDGNDSVFFKDITG